MGMASRPPPGRASSSSSGRRSTAWRSALTLAGLADARSSAIYSGAMLLGSGVGASSALLASRDGHPGQTRGGQLRLRVSRPSRQCSRRSGSPTASSDRAVFGIVAGGLAVGTGAGDRVGGPDAPRGPASVRLPPWASGRLPRRPPLPRDARVQHLTGPATTALVLGWSSLGFMAAGSPPACCSRRRSRDAARMRWINLSAAGGYAVIGLSSLLLAADGTGETR